jgi:hypothetical protein
MNRDGQDRQDKEERRNEREAAFYSSLRPSAFLILHILSILFDSPAHNLKLYPMGLLGYGALERPSGQRLHSVHCNLWASHCKSASGLRKMAYKGVTSGILL